MKETKAEAKRGKQNEKQRDGVYGKIIQRSRNFGIP
jgi:hypothetical protein